MPPRWEGLTRLGIVAPMWETQIELSGRIVSVSVSDATVDQDMPDSVTRHVADLARFDGLARDAMRAGWDDDEFGARLYAEHHEEELGLELLGDPDLLFAQLYLERVSFALDDADRHMVLDYTIGAELTQYVLAVAFDRDGMITEVVMES